MWNIVFINFVFGLVLYGMFMNWGGFVPLVYFFGVSLLGWVFLMFIGIGVVVLFGIFFYCYMSLKSV